MSLKTRISFYFFAALSVTLCGRIGFVYYRFTQSHVNFVKTTSTGIPEVNRKKLSQLVAQCNQGDAETCLSVGYIYLRGILDEDLRDSKQAVNYFEKACDGFKELNQKELQCEAIAKIFETGKEARPDRKFYALFHGKALAAKSEYLKKTSVPEEEMSLETGRCADGLMSSCFHLGENYLKPDRRDLLKAEQSLMRVCDKNSRRSDLPRGEEYPGKFCGLVAEKFEFGREGFSQDLNKAGAIYQKACQIAMDSPEQNGFTCDLAGNFFRDKMNNRQMATSLYKKACQLGLQDSCEHLKKINPD